MAINVSQGQAPIMESRGVRDSIHNMMPPAERAKIEVARGGNESPAVEQMRRGMGKAPSGAPEAGKGGLVDVFG